MEEALHRFLENLIDRVGGPFTFRVLVQPIVALVLAVRAGRRDARMCRPPFGWALVSDPTRRRELLRCGWRDVGGLFAMALLIDVIYQLVVLRWVYPGEALLAATVLALIPYVLARGLVNRVTQMLRRRTGQGKAADAKDAPPSGPSSKPTA